MLPTSIQVWKQFCLDLIDEKIKVINCSDFNPKFRGYDKGQLSDQDRCVDSVSCAHVVDTGKGGASLLFLIALTERTRLRFRCA